jgi:hypothetical protein
MFSSFPLVVVRSPAKELNLLRWALVTDIRQTVEEAVENAFTRQNMKK